MLPLHSKHSHPNGRAQHKHSMLLAGNRLPLMLCLCLAVYLVYQRYYYLELLQKMEDKLYISAKQTSDAQKNLMSAEQKIVNLKNVHEEDTLTVSALSKKVKIGENEQNALASKLQRLGGQYEQLDARFQNLSVVLTELKASYFKKLERNKADIQNANEHLMNADRSANEYRMKLQTCEQEKGVLNQRMNQLSVNNAVPQNNRVLVNNNQAPSIGNANGLNVAPVVRPPLNHYSPRVANINIPGNANLAVDAHKKSNVDTSQTEINLSGESNQGIERKTQSSHGSSDSSNVPESNQIDVISDGKSLNEVRDEVSAPAGEGHDANDGQKLKSEGEHDVDIDEALDNAKQIHAPGQDPPPKEQDLDGNYFEGESSSVENEDPVKEHENIVEKVNSYLKNNLIEKGI